VSGLGWQDLIVAAFVVGAIAYLVRRRRRASQPKASPIVTLGRAPKQHAGGTPPRA
jgi:hypothetical protein